MRCRISHIGKERTVGCLFSVITNIRRSFIADSVCEKVAFGELIVLDAGIISRQGVRFPEIRGTGDNPIVLVESTLTGPAMLGSISTSMPRDMPFTAHIRAVAF